MRPAKVEAGVSVYLVAIPRCTAWFKRTLCFFCADGGKIVKMAQYSGFIDTTGMVPGVYTVKAHIAQSADPWDQADAQATFEVV